MPQRASVVKLAVDVCVGRRGIQVLRDAGFDVVVEADHAEWDRAWFARAMKLGVDAVISGDTDLEILCYDNNVRFIKVKKGLSGVEIAQRAIRILSAV